MFEIISGVLMVGAAMVVADWRCRRWRQLATDWKQIAAEYRSTCVTLSDTANIYKDTAQTWRDVAMGRQPSPDFSGTRNNPTTDGGTEEGP